MRAKHQSSFQSTYMPRMESLNPPTQRLRTILIRRQYPINGVERPYVNTSPAGHLCYEAPHRIQKVLGVLIRPGIGCFNDFEIQTFAFSRI